MNTITCPKCSARLSVVLEEKQEPLNVEVHITQDAAGMFVVGATSNSGRKVILDVVGDGFKNGEIRTHRRNPEKSRPGIDSLWVTESEL